MRKTDFFNRIHQVQREFLLAGLAFGKLQQASRSDPRPLEKVGCGLGSLAKAVANLEATYVLRLFAEFESALRGVYQWVRSKPTVPRTRIELLINWLAGYNGMPAAVRDDAHAVRDYRNAIIHEGGEVTPISLARCKSVLCKFLYYMPDPR